MSYHASLVYLPSQVVKRTWFRFKFDRWINFVIATLNRSFLFAAGERNHKYGRGDQCSQASEKDDLQLG